MNGTIVIRISNDPLHADRWAIVYRDVNNPTNTIKREVLSNTGKWRAKGEADIIFEDEKFRVEEI